MAHQVWFVNCLNCGKLRALPQGQFFCKACRIMGGDQRWLKTHQPRYMVGGKTDQ